MCVVSCTAPGTLTPSHPSGTAGSYLSQRNSCPACWAPCRSSRIFGWRCTCRGYFHLHRETQSITEDTIYTAQQVSDCMHWLVDWLVIRIIHSSQRMVSGDAPFGWWPYLGPRNRHPSHSNPDSCREPCFRLIRAEIDCLRSPGYAERSNRWPLKGKERTISSHSVWKYQIVMLHHRKHCNSMWNNALTSLLLPSSADPSGLV